MAKIKFKVARMGFPAGHVCDESSLREGVVKTLKQFDVLEVIENEQPELDAEKNDKPAGPGRKPRSSKKPSTGGRKQSGRARNKPDQGSN